VPLFSAKKGPHIRSRARRVGHIHSLKIGINLVFAHDGFMSLVKILSVAISLIAKRRILEGDVTVYDIRIVVEFIIKDLGGIHKNETSYS
jgi:hypothetical protein